MTNLTIAFSIGWIGGGALYFCKDAVSAIVVGAITCVCFLAFRHAIGKRGEK